MDSFKRDFIAVIKNSVTGESNQLSGGFDLEYAAKLAQKHNVSGMFYYGLLNAGVPNDNPVMQKLFVLTCQYIAVNERQQFDAVRITGALDKAGVEYMPLKGLVLKKYYPKPEMRAMGDADILIKPEQYGTIKKIMPELGFTEILESNHELIWKSKNLLVEFHKRIIPSYNKDYYAYFGDGWRLAEKDAGTRYKMSAEDNFIYLFTHFAKHYRDGGIGIRHLVDLWVYLKNSPALDKGYIDKELKVLQLKAFYDNICDTIDNWFCGKDETDATVCITDTIFGSGPYGTEEGHKASSALKTSKSAGSARKTKISKAIHLIFPPYSSMCLRYGVLKKAGILLPVMWVARWFDVLLYKRNKISERKNEIKEITQDVIDGYQSRLDKVGLDFNFKE